ILVAKYQFPRNIITNNPSEAVTFFINKSLGLLRNQVFLVSSFIYFLPLIYYVLWQVFHAKFKTKLIYLSLIPLAFIILDVLFINQFLFVTDVLVAIISLSWVLSIIT